MFLSKTGLNSKIEFRICIFSLFLNAFYLGLPDSDFRLPIDHLPYDCSLGMERRRLAEKARVSRLRWQWSCSLCRRFRSFGRLYFARTKAR